MLAVMLDHDAGRLIFGEDTAENENHKNRR